MKISSNSLIRSISPNIKVMAIPVIVLAVVVTLFVYMINVGYSRITKQIEEYKTNQGIEGVLSGKLTLLKNVQSEVEDNTDTTILALPDRNPATWSISQLRQESIKNQVTMDSINVSNPASIEENLNTMDIDIHVVGEDIAKVLNFLMGLTTYAPISTIREAQMEKSQGGGLEASVKTSIYWSQLPLTLPAIDEPVNDLTSEEKQILNQISSLTRPTFTTLEPAAPKERLIPFN